MRIKKIVSLLFVITLLAFNSVADITGPSTIESEIQPIAINKKGEILCKTRFTKNEMGAYSPMKITYGFCIISNGKIIEFTTKVLDVDYNEAVSYEPFFKEAKYWDNIFFSKTTPKQLHQIKKYILKDKYDFTSINADSFRVDRLFSISEFEKSKDISLKSEKQKALHGAHSTKYFNDQKVHVLYDFGNILILKNTSSSDSNESEIEIGANFNYYNSLNTTINEKGKKISFGFDISEVTGVLFLK
ncbi:hypothetical protein [Tenacibaculum agarivorans]|uniref:hypothetical protein n=1 Tax=Tenacibaculum agarivorans TaxID=1908389 RepID=UPI00094B8506|nr:hypothetical protein [Tenacibaculum agarivorans]